MIGEAKYLMEKERKEKEMEMKLMASDIGATPTWMFGLMLSLIAGMLVFIVGSILFKVFFR